MAYKPALLLRVEKGASRDCRLIASVYKEGGTSLLLFRSLPYDPIDGAFALTKRIDSMMSYFKQEGFDVAYTH
jgi:hypothetical protein